MILITSEYSKDTKNRFAHYNISRPSNVLEFSTLTLDSLRKIPRLIAKELIPSHCQELLNRYHFALFLKNARTSMARLARVTRFGQTRYTCLLLLHTLIGHISLRSIKIIIILKLCPSRNYLINVFVIFSDTFNCEKNINIAHCKYKYICLYLLLKALILESIVIR